MTRRQKLIVCSVGGICAIAVVASVGWMLSIPSQVLKGGERFVREAFQPDKDMYPCIHYDTWATWYFAGTKGLPTLQRLSHDESLSPHGRALATNLYQHISTGQHLPCVRWELAHEDTSWSGRYYYRRLLNDDTIYLKERGLPVPEEQEPWDCEQ